VFPPTAQIDTHRFQYDPVHRAGAASRTPARPELSARGSSVHEPVHLENRLEVNDTAVKVLGDDALRTIARELVESVRRNVTIDWTLREGARAKLRTLVKRILRKYGYPPDKEAKARQTVLEQVELIAKDWAELELDQLALYRSLICRYSRSRRSNMDLPARRMRRTQ
jgi:predicted ArsR family transcriptional regulator